MPPVGLRIRLMVPLACMLTAYAAFQTYFTSWTQRTEIFDEATLSTLRLANTVRRSTRHAMLQSRREDVHKMIEDIGEQAGIEHVRIMNKEGVTSPHYRGTFSQSSVNETTVRQRRSRLTHCAS